MADTKKRAASDSQNAGGQTHKKPKREWKPHHAGAKIEPGDAGVFATCTRGKEAKCVNELKNLFEEYKEKLYGDTDEDNGSELDVEAGIKAEISDMKGPQKVVDFQNVNMDVQCVVFIKTQAPIEPVKFVRSICEDIEKTGQQKTRFTQRLSPMEVMGHASEKGLEEAAAVALAPHFHGENGPKKFAIRPNIRHSDRLKREVVIKNVADLVGPKHRVDLTNYDLLILVEVYKTICGISVVGNEFERLKRLNLTEIYETKKGKDAAKNADADEEEE